jgi:hypothetical protein
MKKVFPVHTPSILHGALVGGSLLLLVLYGLTNRNLVSHFNSTFTITPSCFPFYLLPEFVTITTRVWLREMETQRRSA